MWKLSGLLMVAAFGMMFTQSAESVPMAVHPSTISVSRAIALTSCLLISMATAQLSTCSGTSCAPEIGDIIRTDVSNATGPGCNAVLLSNRIILAPVNCLYDVSKRRRHQHLRYMHGDEKISVTKATVVDGSSGKNLAVGLLQYGTGSVTSGLTWSATSVEDMGVRIPKKDSTEPFTCQSQTNGNSAKYLSSRGHQEPVLFSCPGLPGASSGLPLYRPGGEGRSPAVFALDAGSCDGRWGLNRGSNRCATRIGKEAFLSVCQFADKYQQTIENCDDILLKQVDKQHSTLVRNVTNYTFLKASSDEKGLMILHCRTTCRVCKDFVPIYDKLSMHKDVAMKTRLIRLEDADIPELGVKVTPFVEYRKPGASTFVRFNGPFTLDGLLHTLIPVARHKRGIKIKKTVASDMAVCEVSSEGTTAKERRIVRVSGSDLTNDRSVRAATSTILSELNNNEAILEVDVSYLTSTEARDALIERISSAFMEETNSPNIAFKVSQSETVNYGWDQTGTNFLEHDISDVHRRKREVVNWASGCSSVFLNNDTRTAPCPQTSATGYKQLCYRIKNKNNNSYQAIFAVCYDTNKRIPLFTAHVIKPETGTASGDRPPWKQEPEIFSEKGQISVQARDDDYRRLNTNENKYFLNRGHLVPNGDFKGDSVKQRLTFHLTNAAPQWQPADSGNWEHLESRVAGHSKTQNRHIYVLTGTAEHKKFNVKMKNRVVIPGVYWKAVCDVTLEESVLFWSKNPYGSKSTNRQKACGQNQKEERGVVDCLPVSTLNSRFVQGFSGFPAVCKITEVGSNLLDQLNISFS